MVVVNEMPALWPAAARSLYLSVQFIVAYLAENAQHEQTLCRSSVVPMTAQGCEKSLISVVRSRLQILDTTHQAIR